MTTQFNLKLTSSGLPISSILSQNKDVISAVPFSDNCSLHPERQFKLHFKTVDLSGKRIAELFDYYESKGSSSERYLNSHLYNTLQRDKVRYETLLSSYATFPPNSKIYYIDQEIYTYPIFDFYDQSETHF